MPVCACAYSFIYGMHAVNENGTAAAERKLCAQHQLSETRKQRGALRAHQQKISHRCRHSRSFSICVHAPDVAVAVAAVIAGTTERVVRHLSAEMGTRTQYIEHTHYDIHIRMCTTLSATPSKQYTI